ncbi:putative ABC transporter permease [Brucepastera parasyntrophica]|uniref:putative ABC transporter permease n=1 Tax=Brucepastera parasyntrophica TaxID=2880008 RepID=UPI00210E9FE3|nr:putative ABC transporter permease [Brucepastera parasyntrophica]ULQ59768.1 putative ABC transporter permease [Brucepastera parasyntrophica]
MSLSFLFLLFIIYSFIGWACEVLFCFVKDHKWTNRGFLHGPICPVYGIGGLLVIFLLEPFHGNIILLYIMSVIITSTVEYITGWVLETVFNTKWWDYSHHKFNIHGRVCLTNSLLFGVMSVIAVLVVHPAIVHVLSMIPENALKIIAGVLAAVLVVDLLSTLRTLIDLDNRMASVAAYLEHLKTNSSVTEWINENDMKGSVDRLRENIKNNNTEMNRRISEKLDSLLSRSKASARILKAFPRMKNKNSAKQLELFHEDDLAQDSKPEKTATAANEKYIHIPPAASASDHIYELFWVFVIASYVGVFLEMIWCVATRGHLESRTALIYGMTNPIYGAGALLMSLILSRFAKKGDIFLFLGGMIIGGLFEYMCSLGQELIFGSVSWEYSDTQLNLHGRTNLMFSLMWGFLGLVWVRYIYPRLILLIRKIPVKPGKIAAIIVFVALLADASISSIAVSRWSERAKGVAASGRLDEFCDKHYPDDRMEKIYPNMQFVK